MDLVIHGSSIGVAKIEATFSFLSCAKAMPGSAAASSRARRFFMTSRRDRSRLRSRWSWFFYPLVEA